MHLLPVTSSGQWNDLFNSPNHFIVPFFPPLLVLRSLPLSMPAVQLLHGWNASQYPHEHENPLTYMSLNSPGGKKDQREESMCKDLLLSEYPHISL